MPHKPRQSGIPPVQDCYKRIPLPIIHPPSVTLSLPSPNNSTTIVVTFSTAVIISAVPAWIILTTTPGQMPTILSWSTTNLQTYVFTLDQVVNGPIVIQASAGDLSIQSSSGAILAAGSYVSGNLTIASCKCSAIKQILTGTFSNGANGSVTLISLGDGANWQGPGSICGSAIKANLQCQFAVSWVFTFVPSSPNPPFCDGNPGGQVPADNCDQLVIPFPIGGVSCPCSGATVTIPLR